MSCFPYNDVGSRGLFIPFAANYSQSACVWKRSKLIRPSALGSVAAITNLMVLNSNSSLSPMNTSSVAPYTPGQISQAYGFNQIASAVTEAILGNGAGQTIAIVDAYNDPNIGSDLQAFNAQFGLSQPEPHA